MSMIAFLYLQHRRLEAAKRGKNRIGPPPQPSLPAIRTAIIAFFNPGRCRRCPFRPRNSPSSTRVIYQSSASCLVAEHCWDQVRWAIEAYAWRFERLARPARPRRS